MPLNPDVRIRRPLLLAMWVLLSLYVLVLLPHGDGFDFLVDGVLGLVVQWVPAAVCWLAVRRGRVGRALVLVALAVTAYATGSTFSVVGLLFAGSFVFPSPADVGFLLFYPLVLGGLLACVLAQGRRLPKVALLDGAVGALGAGAVLAVLLGPLITPDSGYGSFFVIAVAVAYPLCDLLIVSLGAGIAALPGHATGRYGVLLLAGLAVFSLTDVVYAYQVVGDGHQMGSLLDAGWAAGLCLTAAWANDIGRRGLSPNEGSSAPRVLAVPAVAVTAAMAVLLAGTRLRVPELAVCLAGAALVASMARTHWAFRQLVTLEELRRQSRTDELTGLPNRRALYAEIPERLEVPGARCGALLLLDLDRFKEINDSLGHESGDLLLVQISERLKKCLKPKDLIARIGGDEFAVFLENTTREKSISTAALLREALDEPFLLDGLALQLNASAGIALFPDHGQELKILLRKAELAMYRAKNSRSGHQIHLTEDDHQGDQQLRTLQELRTALAEDQLVLHFQPKLDLATGTISGAEALVRWNHPGRGLLHPGQFLNLAEEAGLMSRLSTRVLAMALDQAATWQGQGRDLTVAVNLSTSSLIDAELPDRIAAMLRERSLPGSAVIVEITEEFMMPDRDRAREILSRLRELGIGISIDDFGTGYSSLAYLRDLPVNELKIDRSFVLAMTTDPKASDLVASIVDLAQSLGLKVVAEGVESSRLLKELASYGCDQAQGFHVSKPLPASELDEWLTQSMYEPKTQELGLAQQGPRSREQQADAQLGHGKPTLRG